VPQPHERERDSTATLAKVLGVAVVLAALGYFTWARFQAGVRPKNRAEELLNQGVTACEQGEYDEGLDLLEQAAEVARRGRQGVEDKARLSLLTGLEADAWMLIGGFRLQRVQDEHRQERAEAVRKGEAYRIPAEGLAPAQEALENAIELKPSARAYYHLGFIYREKGQALQAIETLEEAIRREEGYPQDRVSNELRARMHNDLGEAYAHARQPAQARKHFENAVMLDRDLASAQYNLGLAYHAMSERPDGDRFRNRAARHLRRYLELTEDRKGRAPEREVARDLLKDLPAPAEP